jgi:hypothetical protein
MLQLLPHLLNGVSLGLLFALIALGFMLIVGVMETINLVHGSLFALGMYVAIFLVTPRLGWFPELQAAYVALPLGTVHPGDPDLLDVADEALDRYGFKGFKFHINVQRFHPDDPRILPVYERLIARGGVLLIHVGSAPWPNQYDGFPRFERVMTMFPEMKVIVAHMGQWETRRHLDAEFEMLARMLGDLGLVNR